jgi:hypothetical protein
MDTDLAALVAAGRVWGIRIDGSVAAWLLGVERAEPPEAANGRFATQIINYENGLRVASKLSSAETVFASHELV